MARRLRPVFVRLLQLLCVAGLAWLLWPETIAMDATLADEKGRDAGRRAPRAVPAGPAWLAGDVLLDGRPVASRVTLTGPAGAETVADEAGSFRFDLLPTLQWLAPRPEDSVQVSVCASAGAHVGCATPTVAWGKAPALLRLQLAVGGLLSGVVVDERDEPRPGATVEATGGGQTLRAWSAPDGRFVIAAAPGRYELRASAPHTLRDPGTAVTVEPHAARETKLRLWSSAWLSGTVVDAKGARVRFNAVGVRNGQRSAGQAVQLSKGRFEVDGLVPGPYRIEVEADGFVVQEFDATAPADDLRLALQPGLSLVGTVFDVDGRPRAGARVAALPEDRMSRELGETHTDSYGSFRIDGIAPGVAYYVVAMSEPRAGESSLCAAEKVIAFEKTSGLNLRFEPGRAIRGKVVDSRGRPVPNAWVEAFPDGIALVQSPIATYRATFARADAEGAFTLAHLRFDRYRVFAERPGYDRRADSQAVAATGESQLRLVLSEPGSIRGRVLRPDGSPATEFGVAGRLVRSPDGRFTHPVEDGPTVDLAFTAPLCAQQVRRVQASRGAEVALDDVVLTPPRKVEGVVADEATGEPLSGAAVLLADTGLPDDEGSRAALATPERRTDASGRFSIEDAPLAATLVVRRPGYLSAAVPLTPESAQVAVSLKSGAVVSGKVVANRGLGALTRARVAFVSGRRSLAGEVGADGTFRVAGLWPGAWRVRLWDQERDFDLLPGTVEVPAEGLSGVKLAMRDGGARVTVTGLWDQWAFLVPGQAALPRDWAAWQELTRSAISGEQGLDGALFRSVEPGAYTLFVGLEDRGRELGFYTMPLEVRGLEPQAFEARAPKFVTTLPIPPDAP